MIRTSRVPPKEHKQLVSFTLPPKVLEVLKRKKSYTLFIQAIVMRAQGFCPVCQGRWPLQMKGRKKSKICVPDSIAGAYEPRPK